MEASVYFCMGGSMIFVKASIALMKAFIEASTEALVSFHAKKQVVQETEVVEVSGNW